LDPPTQRNSKGKNAKRKQDATNSLVDKDVIFLIGILAHNNRPTKSPTLKSKKL
jgi:hypothetical protein